jgi:hypothetical protein
MRGSRPNENERESESRREVKKKGGAREVASALYGSNNYAAMILDPCSVKALLLESYDPCFSKMISAFFAVIFSLR